MKTFMVAVETPGGKWNPRRTNSASGAGKIPVADADHTTSTWRMDIHAVLANHFVQLVDGERLRTTAPRAVRWFCLRRDQRDFRVRRHRPVYGSCEELSFSMLRKYTFMAYLMATRRTCKGPVESTSGDGPNLRCRALIRSRGSKWLAGRRLLLTSTYETL